MNNKRARKIRRIITADLPVGLTQYEAIVYTTTLANGQKIVRKTLVTTGAKRAYRIAKRIYRTWGVMPRKPS